MAQHTIAAPSRATTKKIARPKPHPKTPVKSAKRATATGHKAKPQGAKITLSSQLLTLSFVVVALLLVGSIFVLFRQQSPATTASPTNLAVSQQAGKPQVSGNPNNTLTALGKDNSCTQGILLDVIAHEDDDILFMNPDLQQAVAAGTCVRTVYVTAGDDGNDSTYWQKREHGPEAAYAAMANMPNAWNSSTAQVSGHTVAVDQLQADPKISLVFLRLPDGNISGKGFSSDHYESLQKLRNGEINIMHTVDGKSSYSELGLVKTLRNIMYIDRPTTINTQAFSPELAKGDHPDHQAVGYFTSLAALAYAGNASLHRYIGYQSGLMPINLSANQITIKQAAFSAYEGYDSMICNTKCFNSFVYQRYLGREYQQTGATN